MLAVGILLICGLTADPVPLARAHAHNDYAHARPLLDALDNGFCSVEADVFLVDGRLLVGHDRKDLAPDRTLVDLYLKPLQDRIKKNRGSVYRKRSRFTLLIDIKADGEKCYEALKRELKPLEKDLTRFDGHVRQGAVTVILSGERPIEVVAREKRRFAFIDGRMPDLETKPPVSLVPLVSDSYQRLFKWSGEGEMPTEERALMRKQVNAAHAQGRTIRYWATPDTPAVWKELADAGVDYINTDDLPGLKGFLLGGNLDSRP
jgi:hypothetical protein